MQESQSIIEGKELHELDICQAKEVLRAFIETEERNFSDIIIEDIKLDYSKESVSIFLKYVKKMVITNKSEMNVWILRLGYYLGESLLRTSGKLRWDIGEPNMAFENHPVISGFRDGEEAPVITVCRNVLLAVSLDNAPDARIDGAMEHWFDAAHNA